MLIDGRKYAKSSAQADGIEEQLKKEAKSEYKHNDNGNAHEEKVLLLRF